MSGTSFVTITDIEKTMGNRKRNFILGVDYATWQSYTRHTYKPLNKGKHWSTAEIDDVIKKYRSGVRIYTIAKQYLRTWNGVAGILLTKKIIRVNQLSFRNNKEF